MWPCLYLWRFRGRWMLSNIVKFWRMVWRKALKKVGDGGGGMLLSAGQWPKAHIKVSKTMVFGQHYSSIGVACTIPWPKSHWTPLALSQIPTSAVWHTTQRSPWIVGESGGGVEWNFTRNMQFGFQKFILQLCNGSRTGLLFTWLSNEWPGYQYHWSINSCTTSS